MVNLLQGIQTAFNGNGTLSSSFANGCEVELAKDAEALPLCVLSITPPPPPTFQDAGHISPFVDVVTASFTIYSTDPDFVQSMESPLDSVFNGRKINIAPDYNLMTLRWGGGNPYRDEDGRTWRADYTYRFWVERFPS